MGHVAGHERFRTVASSKIVSFTVVIVIFRWLFLVMFQSHSVPPYQNVEVQQQNCTWDRESLRPTMRGLRYQAAVHDAFGARHLHLEGSRPPSKKTKAIPPSGGHQMGEQPGDYRGASLRDLLMPTGGRHRGTRSNGASSQSCSVLSSASSPGGRTLPLSPNTRRMGGKVPGKDIKGSHVRAPQATQSGVRFWGGNLLGFGPGPSLSGNARLSARAII
jgi:hypothetical protein